MTADHVVRRLFQLAGAAGEPADDPSAGPQVGRRRRAAGLRLGKELDAVIAAADDELRAYIRANTDPEAGLAALLADNGNPNPGAARSVSGYKPGIGTGYGRMRHRRGRISAGSRRRKRWAAASAAAVAATTGFWLADQGTVGSVPIAAFSGLVLAVLAMACFRALRWAETGAGHPWVRQIAARPWRDGKDVLNLALRRLPEAFMLMPGNVLLAPAAVELLMNPADLSSLTELIDIEAVNTSAAECYEAEVAAYNAQLTGHGPVKVRVTGDSRIPQGRYRLRRDQRRTGTHPVSQLRPHPGDTHGRDDLAEVADAGARSLTLEDRTGPTIEQSAASPPPLRLVTNGSATETRLAEARAGRGWGAELQLPEDLTVSREHAKFIFTRGQWWVTNLGRNGLVLNGTPLSGQHVVRPGDSICWGCQDGALRSRVEIGAEQGRYAGESC